MKSTCEVRLQRKCSVAYAVCSVKKVWFRNLKKLDSVDSSSYTSLAGKVFGTRPPLFQLRVLGLGLLQDDGNIRIGVFPEGEEIFVFLPSHERGTGHSLKRKPCWMAFRFHPDCGLPFVLVGRHDNACRRYVIANQLHVHGVRGAAEEFLAFSKNYRTGEK